MAGAERVSFSDRRSQLLEVAQQLVREGGLAALTMEALAERANAAKPTVYRHFPNRQAVAVAMIDAHFHAMVAEVWNRAVQAETLTEHLRAMISTSLDYELAAQTPIRKITNGFSGEPAIDAAFRRYRDVFRLQWRRLLAHYGVREERLASGAYILETMLYGAIQSYADPAHRQELGETLETMALAALHAIGADEQAVSKGPIEGLALPTVSEEPLIASRRAAMR